MKPKGKRRLDFSLGALAVLTVLNLLMTASLVGLIGAVVILVMVWGVHRGDYPLVRRLGLLLLIYGTVNLGVLAVIAAAGREVKTSSLLWLGLYSASLLALGGVLRSGPVREYLNTAEPPEKRESRVHFFHGGWRDL